MRTRPWFVTGLCRGVDALRCSRLSDLRVERTGQGVVAELVVTPADGLLAAAEELVQHGTKPGGGRLNPGHCPRAGRGRRLDVLECWLWCACRVLPLSTRLGSVGSGEPCGAHLCAAAPNPPVGRARCPAACAALGLSGAVGFQAARITPATQAARRPWTLQLRQHVTQDDDPQTRRVKRGPTGLVCCYGRRDTWEKAESVLVVIWIFPDDWTARSY